MDLKENKRNICRICLEDNLLLDWNTSLYQFHDMTYKDCYYKYTQLECCAMDSFPQMICQHCCHALRSTHTLILMALKSHKVLQDKLSTDSQLQKELRSPTSMVTDRRYTPEKFETVLVDEIEIESILDEHFKFVGSCDEDFSVACKPAPPSESIGTKRSKTRRQQLFENKIETVIKEPPKNLLEINALLIESEKNINLNVIMTKPISDTVMEFISEEKETLDYNSTEYKTMEDGKIADENLIDENKTTEEKVETSNADTKAKKKKEDEPRLCSICSKILRNKQAVKLHELTHIENRERKETCKVCGIKFYDHKSLYSHMRIHEENRDKCHKCEFCSKAFYYKNALNVHRRIHLGQTIPCSLCSKQFCRQVDLDKHMKSHSATTINSDTKKITKYFVRCKHCDKSISSANFKSHTAAHLNEPLVKCSICEKEFFTRSSCVRHVKKNHQKTNEEYKDFIVMYSKTRISHLFLKQNADVQQVNSVSICV